MPQRILLTGGTGMVGRNVIDRLRDAGLAVNAPNRAEMDLTNSVETAAFFCDFKPDVVINAAGRVGGIQANIQYPADFLVENIDINRNVLMAAHAVDVQMVINLASSCVYSRTSEDPLTEDSILTGELEPTNEGYALAKIFALRLGQYINRQHRKSSFKTVIPCNLYGRYDHFDANRSHMVPAAIHKIHSAKLRSDATVTIWGDGSARREFMYVGDLADMILAGMANFDTLPDVMNVGLGYDLSVKEYYETIADVIGWDGEFLFDTSKPVGMKRKMVDITRQRDWGWDRPTSLRNGIAATYNYYLSEVA